MKLICTFILCFLVSSAYGADTYHSTWPNALSSLMTSHDKFAGFEYSVVYFPGGGDCWDKFIGVPGGYYYFPNPLASGDSACITEYASRGIFILPFVGMSEDEVIEIMFGFCGIVAALCFVIPILRAL